MQYLKLVAGSDISKDKFTSRFGKLDSKTNQTITEEKEFPNNMTGFKQFLAWIKKLVSGLKQTELPEVQFVMDATGVYYENLAYFLAENGMFVSVVLPNKIKYFIKTTNYKSKTDGIDAFAITQYGLEKTLVKWSFPGVQFRRLKELAREYHTIVEDTTRLKNRLHAKNHSYDPNPETKRRIIEQIKFLNQHKKETLKQINEIIEKDEELKSKIKKITAAKGIGLITVVSAITETDGFALVENEKQLTSYAGYDVVHKQSGQKKSKTHISKKGNKHLRRAVYMAAVSASYRNDVYKNFYIRLCKKKEYKRVGIVAIARKILLLIYTLWKNDAVYDPNYKRA